MFPTDIHWSISWSHNTAEEACILALCLSVMFVCKSIDSHFLRIMIYVEAARPGSKRALEGTARPITEPVLLGEDMTLGPTFNLEDPDLHYVYVCIKKGGKPI
ncbi:uncharacterized protein [Physcomitrium patens]|uniref:uncharacterized protein isoform X1 n=1 Tax=Physcomitrium patens TaxID=3218 RepID=UPI003CCD4A20